MSTKRTTMYQEIITAAALITIMIGGVAQADTITLRASVRLSTGASEVRLADIAQLEGEQATKLAGVVVAELDSPNAPLTLSVEQVRAALDAAGAHWGIINLNGALTIVRPAGTGLVAPPLAMQEVKLEGAAAPAEEKVSEGAGLTADQLVSETTLRGAIARRIIAEAEMQPEHLRIEFDGDDDDLLASDASTHRFECQLGSSVRTEKVQLHLRVWRGSEMIAQKTIIVKPSVLRRCAVATREVSRNTTLMRDDYEVKDAWLSLPEADLLLEPEIAGGSTMTRRAGKGDVLRASAVRRQTVVSRGDLVTIRCVVGGVTLSMKAEARGSGGIGETIEFRKLGERDSFLATITNSREAVVDLRQQRGSNPSTIAMH